MTVESLYFIRHGETDMNLHNRCQGRVDTPLNATGHEQARAAADQLDGIRIDHLLVSPLRRAADSAAYIARARGLEPVPCDWLTEFDHGIIEGMNRAEADAVSPGLFDRWSDAPDTVSFPGGETLDDMRSRVARGLLDMCRTLSGNVALVTHQVVTSVARCICFNQPLSGIWIDKIANGQYLLIQLTPDALENIEHSAAGPAQKGAFS